VLFFPLDFGFWLLLLLLLLLLLIEITVADSFSLALVYRQLFVVYVLSRTTIPDLED